MQEQNGASKRDNQTIMEVVRSMLQASNIPIRFWAKATHTTMYTLNRTSTRIVEEQTPFEFWYKAKSPVSHMRIFGIIAYIYVPKELRKKLGPKNRKDVFMGRWAIPLQAKPIGSRAMNYGESMRVEMSYSMKVAQMLTTLKLIPTHGLVLKVNLGPLHTWAVGREAVDFSQSNFRNPSFWPLAPSHYDRPPKGHHPQN